MRFLYGLLYFLTGLVGLFWSIQLTLIGMYGVSFSWWYAAIAFGSVVLIVGAIFQWITVQTWAAWIPLAGSLILAAYFFPAIVVAVYRSFMGQAPGGTELIIRVVVAMLVLFSLGVAANNRFHFTSEGRQRLASHRDS